MAARNLRIQSCNRPAFVVIVRMCSCSRPLSRLYTLNVILIDHIVSNGNCLTLGK